jgi:hypothetical protein
MALDKVQPLKLEDTATGGDGVDLFPTALSPQQDHIEAAGVVFDDASNRDENVRIWRDGADLKFKDPNNVVLTLSDLAAGGGGGMTPSQHRDLYQLVHVLDMTSWDEFIYTGYQLTQHVLWDSSARGRKIQEDLISYTGNFVSQIISKQYDATGTLSEQTTEVFTYSAQYVASVTRTRDL